MAYYARNYDSHDAFRWEGLGKSATLIWQALQSGPMTAPAIATATGRHIATVKRVLGRMSELCDPITGETFGMVEENGTGLWQALDVSLDAVARFLHVEGIGEKQRKRHADERRAHAGALRELRERDEPAPHPIAAARPSQPGRARPRRTPAKCCARLTHRAATGDMMRFCQNHRGRKG